MSSPERSPRELADALRRIDNRLQFFRARQAAAAGPVERAAVTWDQWRALTRDVPAELAARLADDLTDVMNAHIRQMARED
ncbi:hypothetical protein AGRA3207_007869 (plasmid) [Actinomadura graeca]|uniref:Uncharacterized protein n=1 Tax=Actinomadura graeca TaxID=2750812 RepID=A0ABX8R7L4_9ACTN|nr:hypothetical protein [Actinomadura graeca]QXJ27070.1 hypothetical protein AGRA3207_007869 [Actinomadura graeca]